MKRLLLGYFDKSEMFLGGDTLTGDVDYWLGIIFFLLILLVTQEVTQDSSVAFRNMFHY